MNPFEILFKMTIHHTYYPERKCPVIHLQPDPATKRLFHNYQYIFTQVDMHEWAIVGQKEENEKVAISPPVCFQLTVTDPHFLYYTSSLLPEITSKTGLRFDISSHSYKQQDIVCKDLISRIQEEKALPLTCSLLYTAPQRYWEYLLIPRSGKTENRSILLSDTENIIPFGPSERIEWNGTPVYRIRTLQPVDLHALYSTTIQLYEHKTFGSQSRETVKKLLCKNVTPPLPAQLTGETKNTIQQIIYF